jgi:hypothetical protein
MKLSRLATVANTSDDRTTPQRTPHKTLTSEVLQ